MHVGALLGGKHISLALIATQHLLPPVNLLILLIYLKDLREHRGL